MSLKGVMNCWGDMGMGVGYMEMLAMDLQTLDFLTGAYRRNGQDLK